MKSPWLTSRQIHHYILTVNRRIKAMRRLFETTSNLETALKATAVCHLELRTRYPARSLACDLLPWRRKPKGRLIASGKLHTSASLCVSFPEPCEKSICKNQVLPRWWLSGELKFCLRVFTTGSCQDGGCPEVKKNRGVLSPQSYQNGTCHRYLEPNGFSAPILLFVHHWWRELRNGSLVSNALIRGGFVFSNLFD